MAKWRVARTLNVLLAQYDEAYPGRDKSYDGSIGDTAHQATKSDHNPVNGIVRARDFTASRSQGPVLSEAARRTMRARGQDGYVIYHGRICSSAVRSWAWRTYHGSNPHDHHVHVSVHDQLDTRRAWSLGNRGTLVVPAAARLSAAARRPVIATGVPAPLLVDGKLGPLVRGALEWYVGRAQDKTWSRDDVRAIQSWAARPRTGRLTAADVSAIQTKVGATVTGVWVENTTEGVQRYLNRRIADARGRGA